MKKAENPLSLVEKQYDKLSKVGKRVADYVQLHPDKTILLSLQALSEKCSVSDASVLRFCRSLGFSGYQDFKAALVPELLKRGTSIYREIDFGDDFTTVREKFLENLSNDIRKTLMQYSQDIIQSVASRIIRSKNIVIIGLAGSAGVARIFNDCLLGLGIYSTYLSDRVEIERVVSQLDKDGVLFGISHSGETQEVVYALKKGRENRVYTIGMTNFASSSVAKFSDVVLLTTVPENLLGSYSCQPRIAQLAILEFIAFEISTRFNRGGG
jgi:DNA-binding MurR/RpiR family transcriptional regulator